MSELDLKLIIEALLMSASQPLTLDKIRLSFDEAQRPANQEILAAINALSQDYETRAIELKCLARGYCIQTKALYSPWITRLLTEKPVKYSRALLETLAIIAYKQPVSRADIEDIRGVAVSTPIIKSLLEREWIKIAGFRDVPGKPAVYATTKHFLDYFNLKSLNDLPSLELSITTHE